VSIVVLSAPRIHKKIITIRKKTPIGQTGLPGKKWACSNANIIVNTAGPYIDNNDLNTLLKNLFRRFIMAIESSW